MCCEVYLATARIIYLCGGTVKQVLLIGVGRALLNTAQYRIEIDRLSGIAP
jgi:hypothetical protein